MEQAAVDATRTALQGARAHARSLGSTIPSQPSESGLKDPKRFRGVKRA